MSHTPTEQALIDHAAKCVNALAGLNPEAIPELVKAAESLAELIEDHPAKARAARDALARARAKETP